MLRERESFKVYIFHKLRSGFVTSFIAYNAMQLDKS